MKRALLVLSSLLVVLLGGEVYANSNCGGHGQRECTVVEQIPSCDSGLSAKGGKCYNCGGVGEMGCAATVQVPSCDAGLSEIGGTCHECGGEGERPCDVTVQFPSCDAGLSESHGVCRACGTEGQPPCTLGENARGCEKWLNSDVVTNTCNPCGNDGQRECIAQGAPCKAMLWGVDGVCKKEPTTCGMKGQAPCEWDEFRWNHENDQHLCRQQRTPQVPPLWDAGKENRPHHAHVQNGKCQPCSMEGGGVLPKCNAAHVHRQRD